MLVAFASAAAIGWWAGGRTRSPAEVAAETDPPAPSLILAEVEDTGLTRKVVARGTASFGTARPVSIPEPPVLPGANPIVTQVSDEGDVLGEGGVVMEVSFRPVIVSLGRLPTFRDIVRGTKGADVVQLQEALRRLTFYDGEPDGEFGPATQRAVVEWYESIGYAVPGRDLGARSVYVPKEEILFVADLPIRIGSVNVAVGDDPSAVEQILSFTGTRLAIRSAIPLAEASRIRVGDSAELTSDVDGTTVPGTIVKVAERAGTDPEHPGLVAIEIELEERNTELAGTNLKISMTTDETAPGALVVPSSAVYASADETSFVELMLSDGSTQIVNVELGLTAAGRVEVRAQEHILVAGAFVVVGNE